MEKRSFKIFQKLVIIAVGCVFLTTLPMMAHAKNTDIGLGAGVWLPGTVDVEGEDVDKNMCFLIRLFIDSYVVEQFAFGGYANFSNPEFEYGPYKEEATMYEFGLALKYRLLLGNKMPLKIGLNIGYRKMDADAPIDDVEGMGLNLSAELQFSAKGSVTPFIEGGFLTQPAGGNDDADVTWAPIFYVAGGIVF